MTKEFIVGEVTKNYRPGETVTEYISEKFEEIIEENLQRGYELHSFSHSSVLGAYEQQKSIVAVFRKMEVEIKVTKKEKQAVHVVLNTGVIDKIFSSLDEARGYAEGPPKFTVESHEVE